MESYANTGVSLWPEAIGSADGILYGPLDEAEMNAMNAIVPADGVPSPAQNDAAMAQFMAEVGGLKRG